MTYNKGPSTPQEGTGSMVVSRRTVVAGILTVVAAPMVAGKTWATAGRMPLAASKARVQPLHREYHTTTETPFGRVVAGGYRHGALGSVQLFDGDRWHNAAPLLTPRFQHAALAFNGGVLVVGGVGAAGQTLSDVEFFDGNAWTRLEPMISPRAMHALGTYDEMAMVTGGMNRTPLSSVEVYTGSGWSRFPSLIVPRYLHAAGSRNGNPAVFGGRYLSELKTIETFTGESWILHPAGSSDAPQ